MLSHADLVLDRLDEFQATGHQSPAQQTLVLLAALPPAAKPGLGQRAEQRRLGHALFGMTALAEDIQAGHRLGPLTHAGPKYLRWALMEAATHACRHQAYTARYQANKQRLGKQRGAKVAQVDIARRLAEAIWHMLTRNQPFAPAGATEGSGLGVCVGGCRGAAATLASSAMAVAREMEWLHHLEAD